MFQCNTTNFSGDYTTNCTAIADCNYIEPYMDCSHLCYDCELGEYCWASDANSDNE